MKNLFLLILLCMSIFRLEAQTKSTTVKAKPGPAKPASAKPVTAKTATPIKTLYDSACYAIGVSVGNAYKKQGLKQLNTTLVSKAINDFLGGKETLFDLRTAESIMGKYVQSLRTVNSVPKPSPVKSQVSKPTGLLKNLYDSASYAVGVNVGNFYKQFGMRSLNTVVLSKSVNEVMADKKVLMNDATVNSVITKYLTKLEEENAKPTIAEGEAFLEKNKLNPNVKITPSGLQYEVIREGTGPSPIATDSVVCHYTGAYISGVEFNNSYKMGAPLTFAVKGVIRGWTEGLQLMKVGAKYKFYIPYTLGYGVFDANGIPGGSALVFEIDLLEVRKGPGSPKGN